MKLLIITYSLSSGGAERFLTDMLSELSLKKDVQITLLMIKSNKIEENVFYLHELDKKIKVESLGIKKIDLSIIYKLYYAIKKSNPDIVHIHLSPIILYTIGAIMLLHKKVYIETLHNEVARIDNSNKIKRWLKYLVYHFNNVKICTISDKNANEFKRIYGIDCDTLIYNGRKKMEPSRNFKNIKAEIQTYKIDANTLVITHIARCAPQKNQDLLIDSFNLLIEQGYNVTLLVIGNGFDSKKGLELKGKASKAIHFLGEKHDIQDYLMCSDAFCLSSLYEGMPITLIEALAYGCIPLSTPVSGITDLIIDGKNGFVASDFTLKSYIDMLNRYLTHRKNINKKELIELYENKLSIKACTNAYYDFYKYCLYKKNNK